ncbi:MAG: protein kinase [Myxococcales bacterium]|nr:protein kinase [Myxococcales bacterium]
MDDLGSELGRYRLLERLGGGGMGEVFLAELRGEEGFTRRLALKRMRPELSRDARFREMFASEARLAAQLHHPNIIQVFDFGRLGSECFLAMEYVQGLDLARLLDRARSLARTVPRPLALAVAAGCLRGLEYAHRLEPPLVHGDICPANLLLGISGEVKILDFGLARLAHPGGAENEVRGHPGYMAPEVAFGEPAGPAADLFAVGAVLYELLAGVGPLEPTDPSEFLLESARRCRIPPLQALRPEIPAAAADVVQRALAADPARRFSSAQEMEDALVRLAAAERAEMGPRVVADFCQALMAQPPGPSVSGVSPTLVAKTPPVRSARRQRLAWGGTILGLVALSAAAWWAWPDSSVPPPATESPLPTVDAGTAPDAASAAVGSDVPAFGGAGSLEEAAVDDGGVASAKTRDAGPRSPGRKGSSLAPDEPGPGGDPAPPDASRASRDEDADGGAGVGTEGAVVRGLSVRADREVRCALDDGPAAPCPLTAGAELAGAHLLSVEDDEGLRIRVRLENEGGGYLLALQSEPFAILSLDGEPRGLTPLANVRLGRGAHAVTFAAEGRRSLTLYLFLP